MSRRSESKKYKKPAEEGPTSGPGSQAFYHRVAAALDQKWPGRYAGFLALLLLYEAVVHVVNMIGIEVPWGSFPLHWRLMDIVMLVFSLFVGGGLWFKAAWSVYAVFFGIILFQLLPYTLFRDAFVQNPEAAGALNILLGVEGALLLVFALILTWAARRVQEVSDLG